MSDNSKKKFPIYEGGKNYWKVAHPIKNSHMHKLYEFFNPNKNQVHIFGSEHIGGREVPNFLEALGYDVTWDEEDPKEPGCRMWYAKIPEHFRRKIVTVEKEINW